MSLDEKKKTEKTAIAEKHLKFVNKIKELKSELREMKADATHDEIKAKKIDIEIAEKELEIVILRDEKAKIKK